MAVIREPFRSFQRPVCRRIRTLHALLVRSTKLNARARSIRHERGAPNDSATVTTAFGTEKTYFKSES